MSKLENISSNGMQKNVTLTPDSLVAKKLYGVGPFLKEKDIIFPEKIKENLHLTNIKEKGLDPKKIENINMDGLNLDQIMMPGNLNPESLVDISLEGINHEEEQNKVR